VNELPDRELMRDGRWFGLTPDLLLEAGQIEPGHADGDREGGLAQQMETR